MGGNMLADVNGEEGATNVCIVKPVLRPPV